MNTISTVLNSFNRAFKAIAIGAAMCLVLPQLLLAQDEEKLKLKGMESIPPQKQTSFIVPEKPSLIIPDMPYPAHSKAAVFNNYFELTPHDQLSLVKTETDKLGFTHQKHQQMYKGVEVEGAVYTTHVQHGLIKSLTGNFYTIKDLSVQPKVSAQQAFQNALNYVGATQYAWDKGNSLGYSSLGKPTGKLVIYALAEHANSPKLAFKYNIYASEPLYKADVFVDAHTGKIIAEHNQILNGDVAATGDSQFQGNVPFTADEVNPTSFRLRQAAMGMGVETYNMNNGTSYGAATDFTSATTNFTSDAVGVQAHYSAEQTYDYFMSVHGRDSYDNAGSKLLSYVHFSTNYVNAFWDGTRMTYGDGNGGSILPLVTLDICGHEIAHGVTQFSAGLIYQNESGALNESFSDIFGEAVERHALGGNNWLLASEIFVNGGAIRNMANPNQYGDPDTYHGTFWYFGSGDNGGVHTNSGVQNFWFFLLTNGGAGVNDNGDPYNFVGIGFDAAAEIAYRNLTVYLNPGSQYADARAGAIMAAEDLYGPGSPEAIAVADAWDAVGVYAPPAPPANDDVCGAIAMTLGVPANANSTNATAQPGEVSPGAGTNPSGSCDSQDGWCSFETDVQNSLWYTFVAPPSGAVEVFTDDTDDTQLAIWEVGDCSNFGAFIEIGANDDGGPVFAPYIFTCSVLTPGQTYYVQIDGFAGVAYNTNITVVETILPPPLDNDDVCDALPMTIGVPINANSHPHPCVPSASAQPGEVDPGPGTVPGNSCDSQDGWCNIGSEPIATMTLWYTFVAPPSGTVDVFTDNTNDTQLAIWEVGDCSNFGSFVEIAANDDGGPIYAPHIISACVTPGQTYYVQIDGYQTTQYNTNITVLEVGNALAITCPADITITCADPTDPSFTGEATANTNLCCVNPATISHNDVTDYNNFQITRTWMATYDCGEVLTCDQVITIDPGLFYFGSTATAESCGGAGDGSIVIDAISQGGQLGYSIDGGANYQFNNTFNNLSAGSYNIRVKLFGIPEVCEQIDDVMVPGGPAPTVWYQDFDNDNWSSGHTVLSCTQPPGYKAFGDLDGGTVDCKDSDPNTYPGAPELCDGLDNDCDGVVPATETDDDGDGMSECEGDCDDADATVYTGAPELCDGKDNDCNGLIDDGVPTTYVGNVTFVTQADVDAWPSCYTTIDGHVTITGTNISNLGPLSNVTTITGALTIYYNSSLTSLNGLDNLTSVGAGLTMYYNFLLSNCCAIYNLLDNGGVTGSILIFFNAVGCNSQAEILSNCAPAPIVGGGNDQIGWDFNTMADLALFPNPASDVVNIVFSRTASSATLKVVDMLGRSVFVQQLGEGTDRLEIDLGNGQFENGIYLVTLIEGGEMITKQMVVQH